MSHVLLLISNPQSRAVTAEMTRAVADALGWPAAEFNTLSPAVACEMALPRAAAAGAEDKARAAIGAAPIDVALVPATERRKKLFVADMDSTMIEQECIDEIGALKGIKAEISAITARAMRGEIAFEQALRQRVALLKGVSRAEIDDLIAARLTLTPGGRAAVRTMRANGAYCVLVSGGFTLFTAAIAARIGFDEHRANTLLESDGALSGEVAAPILGQDAKSAALSDIAAARRLTLAETLAVGDGANDLAMIELAGLGVAFRAKPVLAAKADVRIAHGDLTALLYLQGYRDNEFARG